MSELVRHLRLAVRQLLARPALSALAVVSLALGIGVNSSIFSIVNAVLLRELPARRPAELVEVYTSDSDGILYSTSSYPDFLDLRRDNEVLTSLAAHNISILTYDTGQRTELLFGEEVSANYFELLGVSPTLGRGFNRQEDTPGAHPVVVLGDGFWHRRFGGDPGALGASVELNGVPFTVVGVAPPELKGSVGGFAADYWIPMAMHDAVAESASLEERGHRSIFLKGRLSPGVSLEQAQAHFDTLASRLEAAHPETNEGRRLTLVPSRKVAINPVIDGPLFGAAGLLMVVVGLVLLIACSNIANLLLARAADRRKEIAVRLAMGAGRGRLIRQLLTESLLLAALGAALGLLLAFWVTQLVVSFKPALPLPLALDFGLDLRVLAFTLALAVAAGLLCGLAPAIQASKPQLVAALKDDATALGRRYRQLGLRNLLVVVQVAVSTVLLIGAGLFVRSLMNAQDIDPGFRLRRGVVAQVALGLGGSYNDEEARVFLRQLEERARALPGVRSAALAEHLPLGLAVHSSRVELEGQELAEGERGPQVDLTAVGPGYFATMGIDLPWGRALSPALSPDDPGEVVVNETAARRFWPGQSPLGKRLRFGEDGEWLEVVGVAADGKYRTLGEEPRSFVYRSYLGEDPFLMTLVVAAEGDEGELMRRVRSEIEALAPDVPIFDLRTMSDHLSIMLFPARMGAWMLAGFGLLGLLLASVGIYGVVAYSVTRRTREVGIRRAIGARDADVLRLVVGEGMALVAVGTVVGVALALLVGQALRSFLYGISASDPLTFVAVPGLLLMVALTANLLPARRATQVDPLQALRWE